ncbi:MAG: glycosyltransferase family 9 protein [Phycisphaerales bacterium]
MTTSMADFTRGVQRLLVVMPTWIGDSVMATPFLRALRSHPDLHDASIVTYGRSGIDEALAGLPYLDEQIVGRASGLTGPWREGRRLSSRRFDGVVLLPNSWRSAAMAFAARIPRRLGFARNSREGLLTHRVGCPSAEGWKGSISAVDYYLALARAIGGVNMDRRLVLECTAQQRIAAQRLLDRVGIDPARRLAVLNPGASRAEKRWPVDRFASIAETLSRRHGMTVLVNGSPSEQRLVGAICAASKAPCVDLTASGVTISTLKPILRRARLLVTNDTGTRHLAVAVNHDAPSPIPVVSLFGPTDPRTSSIEADRERIVTSPDEHMRGISVEAVESAIESVLDSDDSRPDVVVRRSKNSTPRVSAPPVPEMNDPP